MTPPAGLGRIEEKIDGILRIQEETQAMLKELTACYQKSQMDYTRANVILEQKADAAHSRLDEQQKDIAAMKTSVQSIVTQYKIINFIAGAFGLSLIGLIWGIITHSVAITIP